MSSDKFWQGHQSVLIGVKGRFKKESKAELTDNLVKRWVIFSGVSRTIFKLFTSTYPPRIFESFQLRCYATIYNVYKSFSDKMIEEVIPRILATGHNGAATFLQPPYDESSSSSNNNGLMPDHQMDENGMLVQRDHDSYLQQQYNGESRGVNY